MKKVFMTGFLCFCIMGTAWAERPLDPGLPLIAFSRGSEVVQDYAHVLEDMHDYTEKYLKMIRDQYAIEAVVASIPGCGAEHSIEDVAVMMMENWEIGKKYEGRGILLLLADDKKQVKMEVGRELEDVFTDAFTGYIEDKQLRNYYLAGDVGTGLIAVLEEIEKRARVKSTMPLRDDAVIPHLDNEFITQGAGARRDLTQYQTAEVSEVGAQYPAGATPDEAWQTIIRSYKNKVRDPDLGVYTAITRRAYKDYANLPDSHYTEEYNKYKDKPYEIIEHGDYAVVFFGNKKGWDNAPFLLSRTSDGWQFDIVYQRKYIRMGRNPHWMMERADYPYARLLSKCPWSMGQDIPLEGEDIYRAAEDALLAQQILSDEAACKRDPKNMDSLISYGTLLTKTAFNRKAIQIWDQVKAMDPDNAYAHKYLAISHVDAFYQYDKAIAELEQYVMQVPGDVFGHNYLGYLYLHQGKYDKAIKQLEKAVELRGDNIYALCKLSRAYAQKYLKSSPLDIFRNEYKKKAFQYYEKAKAEDTSDSLRLWWLELWLKEEGVL